MIIKPCFSTYFFVPTLTIDFSFRSMQDTSRRLASSPVHLTASSVSGPTGHVVANPAAVGSKFALSGSGKSRITVGDLVLN